MMELNIEQLVKIVTKQKFKFCKVYEGRTDDFTHCFGKFEETSPSKLAETMQEFSEDYPFVFTVILKHDKSASNGNSKVTCNFTSVETQSTQSTQEHVSTTIQGFSVKDLEQREAILRKDMLHEFDKRENLRIEKEKEAFARKELITKNKDLESKIAEFETFGGKFSYALEEVAKRYMENRYSKAAAGMGNMNGTTINELEQAMAVLVKSFGKSGVIKIAQELTDNPHMIGLIKTHFKI